MLKQLSLRFDLHSDRPLGLGLKPSQNLVTTQMRLWVVWLFLPTLVDVCKHEAGQFDRLSCEDDELDDLADEVFGGLFNSCERSQLDILLPAETRWCTMGAVAGVSVRVMMRLY